MTAITAKYDPDTEEIFNPPDQQVPAIDTDKISPHVGRALGGTFYAAMQRFYADPENVRRFEAWRKDREQNRKETLHENS